jgi:hypothetical protein
MAMSDNSVRKMNPVFGRLRQELDPRNVRVDYNEYSDTLYVYVLPGNHPLVSVPRDDGFSALMLDPLSEEVHGFQFDDYLTRAVLEVPQLIELAEMAGIDSQVIDLARQQIGEERRKDSVISATIAHLLRSADPFPSS